MAKNDKKEEHVMILDYLAHGYVDDDTPLHKKKSLAQGVGVDTFTLLELIPKKDIHLQPLQKVYVGKGKRDKIHHISTRLNYEKLTSTAQAELKHALKEIIEDRETEFVNFFNKAQPLNTRTHILQMLPGVGKKHLENVLEERKAKKFENLDDLQTRVKAMGDPKEILAERIINEIKGEEKHNLFLDN